MFKKFPWGIHTRRHTPWAATQGLGGLWPRSNDTVLPNGPVSPKDSNFQLLVNFRVVNIYETIEGNLRKRKKILKVGYFQIFIAFLCFEMAYGIMIHTDLKPKDSLNSRL